MKKCKTRLLSVLCTVGCAVIAGVAGMFGAPVKNAIAEGAVENSKNLVYKLDFSKSTNRGENSAPIPAGGGTAIGDATITGGSYIENAIKGKPAFKISESSGLRQNYVSIPGDVFNYDTVTFAGWFKIDLGVNGYDPCYRRLWEYNKNANDNTFISVMPYHVGYNKGLNFCVKKNGTAFYGDENLFKGNISDSRGVPTEHYILPVYDAWVHYAYVISPTGVKYYQNGRLLKTVTWTDTKASSFYGENAKLYLGATNMDGTADLRASFADIRVYASELNGADIVSEYALAYTDFLTASYDFEDGVVDSVRGYTGTLVKNAKIENDTERNSKVLVLDGTRDGNNKTSFTIPGVSILGHSSLSVSMDLYINSLTPSWSYITAFERDGGKHVLLGGKWGGSDTIKVLCGLQGETNRAEMSSNTPYNKWINITFTLDGVTKYAAMYINGMLVAENANCEYNNAIFGEWWTLNALSFGKIDFYNDAPFIGKFDNIKIFQTALTAKQIMFFQGVTDIEDDNTAVTQEQGKFDLTYNGTDAKIDLPKQVGNGVTVTWTSSNTDVITTAGDVITPADGNKNVTLTATFKRGEVTMTKTFDLTVNTRQVTDPSIYFITALDDVRFTANSHMESLMKSNFNNFMMKLDPERLLYNYRLVAGLDTKGVQGYGAWISTESDGAGQFEAHYIVALIKYCRSMPELTYKGKTVLQMTKYLVDELKKCQDAFATANPTHAGFLGGIKVEDFDAMALHNGVRPSDGKRVWVPWYMQHKQLEMMLDVYNYSPDVELKATALDMLGDFADWCYNTMSKYTDAQRAKMLEWEYGGMAEALWQTYGITKKTEHYKAAKYFEEQDFLQNLKNNTDCLTSKHSNTTIPKILGAAMAYEVLGDIDYKTMCVNAYEMIMKRTFANGSTSHQERWSTPNDLDEGFETSETCCSYNMLKLADYLYRWTGAKKYADYMENVYTNHILASMAPDTGLKTYLTNSEFGQYKIYHTIDTTFWCCSATGMESFSKLTQFIYYTAQDELRVNMFYPSTVKLTDTISVEQSGNFYTDQKTKFTVKGSGTFTLALRLPGWADDTKITIKVNGTANNVEATDGYYNITREWADGDTVDYEVPFDYRLDTLEKHRDTKTSALFYGPLMYVLDLGNVDVRDVREDNERLTRGSKYMGNLSRNIVTDGTLDNACSVTNTGAEIYLTMKTLNHGDIIFRPFNQVFHSRYGMYLDYFDSVSEIERKYTLPDANEKATEFIDSGSLDGFTQYSTDNKYAQVENGKLVTPFIKEYKMLSNMSLSAPYVVDASFRGYDKDAEIHAGIYVLASGAANGLDQIKAYLACVYKAQDAKTAMLHIYKFNHSYVDLNVNTKLNVPADGVFALHVYVTETQIKVYVNGSETPALTHNIDTTFITEQTTDVGIRTYYTKAIVYDYRVISTGFTMPDNNLLQTAVTKANEINIDDYTSQSYNAVKAQLEEATAILNNSASTQRQINLANSTLRAALAALKDRADTTALKNAIATARALASDRYTGESFAVLTAAISATERYNLDDITTTQAQTLESTLKNAMFGLVAAETPTPDDPTPDVPGDPSTETSVVVNNVVGGGWKAAAITLICLVAVAASAGGAYAAYVYLKKRKAVIKKDGE